LIANLSTYDGQNAGPLIADLGDPITYVGPLTTDLNDPITCDGQSAGPLIADLGDPITYVGPLAADLNDPITYVHIRHPDLQVLSTQLHEQLYFPQPPDIEVDFDFSILPPPVTWCEDPVLVNDADFMSITGSKTEEELGTHSIEEEFLISITRALTPEDYGTSTSSLPNQSNSTSPPHAGQSDPAMLLVCCDCPHRPSFGQPHQYKCVVLSYRRKKNC